MKNSEIKLSVVVPMYFEEAVVEECHSRLSAVVSDYDYEVIYVNDGSTDNTLPMLKDIASKNNRIKIISFSRNFGHQAAVTAGVKYATGDCIVIIDADLQDPPEIIPDMINLWQEGYEVVYAKRKKRKGESFFKRLTAKAFYRILGSLTDTKIPNDTGDFRLIDRKVANAFKQMGEHNRFIRGMVAWLGFKQIPIEYVRDVRYAGETKYPLKKMLKLALDGIMSFSTKPIKLVTNLGALTLLFSFGIIVYVLISKFTGNAISDGWASTMIVITMLSGVQLISLGVVGGYISRIYEESRNRPIYLISEEVNIEEEADEN
ncbi:MAG: glycosyltransferase family 2 protein [Clostridiales bacterium]|nr:glycosyltransferase family 2 protein [Clostridiales bacterium]